MKLNTIHDVLSKLEADPNGGCWLWSGVINPGGYGMVKWAGAPTLAHRLIYKFLVGSIADGLHLCHRCDVRACCNPAHLFPGTPQENMQDRSQKGRSYRGQAQWTAKLSRGEALHVLALYLSKVSQREIARRTGVKVANVHLIVHRRTWAHLSESEISAWGAQNGVVFHDAQAVAA